MCKRVHFIYTDKRHAEDLLRMEQSRREEMEIMLQRLTELMNKKKSQECEASGSVWRVGDDDTSVDILQGKIGVHDGEQGGMIGASVNVASTKGAPVNATLGLSCDTGAMIEDGSLSAKILGTGITIGRKVEVSFLGTSLGLDFGPIVKWFK